jgi:hypothetical protein
MSVVLTADDHWHLLGAPKDAACAVCGETAFHPFLWWRTVDTAGDPTDLVICGDCCLKIREEFIVDIIHAAAIIEMQRIRGGFTLKRTTHAEIRVEMGAGE